MCTWWMLFDRCIDGSSPTENAATKVLPRRPPIRVPGLIKGPGLSPIFKAFNNFRGKTKTDGVGKIKNFMNGILLIMILKFMIIKANI
jgi:hypothetical protein